MRTTVRILDYGNSNRRDGKSAFPKEYARCLQEGSTGSVLGQACLECVFNEEQWIGT